MSRILANITQRMAGKPAAYHTIKMPWLPVTSQVSLVSVEGRLNMLPNCITKITTPLPQVHNDHFSHDTHRPLANTALGPRNLMEDISMKRSLATISSPFSTPSAPSHHESPYRLTKISTSHTTRRPLRHRGQTEEAIRAIVDIVLRKYRHVTGDSLLPLREVCYDPLSRDVFVKTQNSVLKVFRGTDAEEIGWEVLSVLDFELDYVRWSSPKPELVPRKVIGDIRYYP